MNNNNWLDIDVLEDYLDGKLDAKTMHRVERLSLEDPFVAEALAGLSVSPKRVQSLSLLQKQLQERIAQKPVQQKRWQITSQRLSIAAAAAVLFVTVSLLFWMREKSNREQIVANTPKKVEVAIAPTPATEKPITKAKVEVEKIITEAKINSYANQSKKVKLQPVVEAAVTESKPVQNAEMKAKMISSTSLMKVKEAAEPVGGWDKFEEYVINNNKLLKDKKLTGRYITVSFKVNESGEAIDIRVVNKSNTAEESEAIRLVKEGPKWLLVTNSGSSSNEATVNIKF